MSQQPEGAAYLVRYADWEREAAALQAIRREVFVIEQQVPEHEEWDELDARCLHVLALTPERDPIGTGRLAPDGRIGRIAVRKSHRRHGVGGRIVQELVRQARAMGMPAVHLHAQTHAVHFYARHGFAAHGPEFLEAGIPHVAMRRRLMP